MDITHKLQLNLIQYKTTITLQLLKKTNLIYKKKLNNCSCVHTCGVE